MNKKEFYIKLIFAKKEMAQLGKEYKPNHIFIPCKIFEKLKGSSFNTTHWLYVYIMREIFKYIDTGELKIFDINKKSYYTNLEQLKKLTGIKTEKTIKKHLKILQETNFIEIEVIDE
jgi:hypothetical protein